VDAAPVFGTQIFERQRIRNLTGIKSMSLISNDNEYSFVEFTAAAHVNQLAGIQAIAVEHCVTQCFLKREFNEVLPSVNATRRSDQAHQPIH
jgi:hypothetical protein